MAKLLSLNLPNPPAPEKRSNLENPMVSLSAGLASMGMGTFTDSNERVTERSSLEVPTMLACVRILSEGVGQLPLRVYEELERGRRPAKDHYLTYLLGVRPNPDMSAKTFFNTLMTHAVLWQNAYAEIERDNNGRVVAFWPRAPWSTKSDRVGGRLVFKTKDTLGAVERIIEADNMIHIVGFSLDGLSGSSLVQYARQSIGLAMVAGRFGARFYANGARPGFFLQPEEPLTPEQMTELRQDVEMLSSGANVHRVAALPGGVKVTEIKIDPAQAEYNQTRMFERAEIAAFMRVPGYMVGANEKALKSTVEAQNMEFLTYSLRPWIEGIEQEFQHKLLPLIGRSSGKYSIHFFTKVLLSMDGAVSAACNTQGRNGGWLSVNDIREADNMEPIEGGDVYLQPLNMVPAATAAEGVETEDEGTVQPDPNDPALASRATFNALTKQAFNELQQRNVQATIHMAAQKPVESFTATRAKQIYTPLLKDAISRLQHRSKCDSAAITQTLMPVCEALGTYFRTSSTAGTEETRAIEKYLKGVESRSTKWEGDPTEDEFQKLSRAVVFSIEADNAEARAKKVLND